MTVQHHSAHGHRSFPVVSLGSSGTFTLLSGLLKEQLRCCQFHNNAEVEMAGCECKRVIYTVMKFLNSCQGWTHAAVCSGTFNILMTFTLIFVLDIILKHSLKTSESMYLPFSATWERPSQPKSMYEYGCDLFIFVGKILNEFLCLWSLCFMVLGSQTVIKN